MAALASLITLHTRTKQSSACYQSLIPSRMYFAGSSRPAEPASDGGPFEASFIRGSGLYVPPYPPRPTTKASSLALLWTAPAQPRRRLARFHLRDAFLLVQGAAPEHPRPVDAGRGEADLRRRGCALREEDARAAGGAAPADRRRPVHQRRADLAGAPARGLAGDPHLQAARADAGDHGRSGRAKRGLGEARRRGDRRARRHGRAHRVDHRRGDLRPGSGALVDPRA